MLDAVVVGSGPNGLTAAVTLAGRGLAVAVYEAASTIGGGTRTAELTLPGFRHDVCSAVHPLGIGSPAWRALPLGDHGLEWVQPELPLAHPLDSGAEAVVLARSVHETAAALGRDAAAYLRMIGPFVDDWEALADVALRAPWDSLRRRPRLAVRFGVRALLPASVLARRFRTEPARALLAGLAAHSMAPLHAPPTAALGVVFAAAAHTVGWPFPRGGSQAVADALGSYLRSLGGELHVGHPVTGLDALPPARAYLLDVSPRALATIAGSQLPDRYLRRLGRFRYGPGVFKVDYALREAVPWTAEACRRAGSVHLGPSVDEIGAALQAVDRGRVPEPPFVIAAQPALFDPSRAPEGGHVLWAYGHVPSRWDGDLGAAIDRQIERFAPGFRDLIIARSSAGPAALEAANPNYVGGDIGGGRMAGHQAVFRPVVSLRPYATPNPAVFLCSSATPPGPGVHGICGWQAAQLALRRVFGLRPDASSVADRRPEGEQG